jgi:hypothetical protein
VGAPAGRGGVSFVSQGDGSVAGVVLHDDQLQGGYFNLLFPSAAPRCHNGDGFSDPTGTAGDENVADFGQVEAVYHIIGTQTILAPTIDRSATGTGPLVHMDEAAGDGVEYVFGSGLALANNPQAMAVGTGPGRFLKMVMAAGTVANVAELAVGFRKAADFAALIDDYTDLACLNLQYDTDAAYVRVETILNDGATATTEAGVTIADAEAFTFEVRVRADGKVSFFVNGVKVGHTFTFDDGDAILPFVHFLQVTGGCSLGWTQAEGGALWHVRKDPKIQAA